MTHLIADALRQRRLITVLVAVVLLLLHAWLHVALPANVIAWGSGIVMSFLLGESFVEGKVHQASATTHEPAGGTGAGTPPTAS
jgi:ABC-type uncharacterized transport system permease subunit